MLSLSTKDYEEKVLKCTYNVSHIGMEVSTMDLFLLLIFGLWYTVQNFPMTKGAMNCQQNGEIRGHYEAKRLVIPTEIHTEKESLF